MASLVEIRLVHEKAKKDESQIKVLAKEHSNKLYQKIDKLLSRDPCSQVDCLSVNCSRNEELNYHLDDENERLNSELQRISNSLTTSRNPHSSALANYKRLEEDNERVIQSKAKVMVDLRKSRNKVASLNEEIDCLKKKVELLQAKLDNSTRSRSTKSTDSCKNKGALVIQSDKDTSNSGHGTESEVRHKNQVLRLSRETDEFRTEVSRLTTEVSDLNADMDEMIATSMKVAKLARKNIQDYLVSLFGNFCDEHDLPRPVFLMEVFSDDDQPKDDWIISGEEDRLDEDGEEQKIDEANFGEEESKGASASTDVGPGEAGNDDILPQK
ncbi:uncharacterized protein LOC113358103 [Papaver somniferum]|uniref:uncharacterized protein LOC113358103 n=1 Tax=Papaver somniferum TaxID=3469 RepID=UPI000E704120|nr:uncharacterized protein LOC113358103 [Papaver somniferum]